MKHLLTKFVLLSLLLVVCQTAFAQPKHALQYRRVFYNYIAPQTDGSDFNDIYSGHQGSGIELAYHRSLFRNAWLVVPAQIGVGPLAPASKDKWFANLDAGIQFNAFKYGSLINPTAGVGIGSNYNINDKEFKLNVPLTLGLNLRVMENLYATAGTQYRLGLEENTNGWHHSIGGILYFGDRVKDRDKDGTPDDTDECPDTPGPKELMGCPDKDGDGVADKSDKCPTIPGPKELMGCPDKDGDGIADKDDKCPDVKGLAELKGCPDKDGDGIADSDDACPDVKGLAALKGCPDKDGDGVADKDDACPDVKGVASNKGCPSDRDGDGIYDTDDACPDAKGTAANKGCPDRDGDGVVDKDDRCPDKPGPATNKGCPEIKVEDKKKVELAIKLVQFETGKATLLPASNKVLDDVADVLKKYPEYSLSIEGHTDNQGDDARNLDLSQRRAKTCYDYLVAKGVDAARLSHAGFGETKPVADNTTAAGRAQNRRVEFGLNIK
jgi:OmpA-OmpF porin, OOP family